MTRLLLLSCLALLSGSACTKQDPNALPEATQQGKNTAGFLLDGQVWLPKPTRLAAPSSAVGASWRKTREGRSLQFGFGRAQDQDQALDRTGCGFYIPDIRQAGTYALQEDGNLFTGNKLASYGEYIIFYPKPDRYFHTGSMAPGRLIITRFDTVARVVAGTFELTVRELKGTETHQITQGRFDLTF